MNQFKTVFAVAAGFMVAVGLSSTAVADDQLDRFEEISERGTEVMMEVMVKEYVARGMDEEAIRGAVPDSAWDEEYREAGQCMLDGYRDLIGSSGVDDMLDQMESMFNSVDPETATLESMNAFDNVEATASVSTEQQMAITQDCGMVEISMRRMSESGFMQIIQTHMMQDPD